MKFRFEIQKWSDRSFSPVPKQWLMDLSDIISTRQFTNDSNLGCTLRDSDFTGLSWTSDISIKNKYMPLWMPPEDSVVQPYLGITGIRNLLNAQIPSITWVTKGPPVSEHSQKEDQWLSHSQWWLPGPQYWEGFWGCIYIQWKRETGWLVHSALGIGKGDMPTCTCHSWSELSTLNSI